MTSWLTDGLPWSIEAVPGLSGLQTQISIQIRGLSVWLMDEIPDRDRKGLEAVSGGRQRLDEGVKGIVRDSLIGIPGPDRSTGPMVSTEH